MSTPDSPQANLAVEIRSLTKRYALPWKRKVLVAVDQLNLTVRRGEVFGLLGPNGSGKSTTLKMLLSLIKPSEGEAWIFGQPVDTIEARRTVGFLPENPYFYKFLNGDETLRFYGGLAGMQGLALDHKIEELIKLVGLENGRDRPLSAYSKGMLQRIGLAQALIHDPELLFLDEPTAGVDPIGSREIRDLIVRLRDMGKTVVFSSHLLEQVQEVADRVAIMSLGKKMVEGSLDDLLTVQDRTQFIAQDLSPAAQEEVRKLIEQRGGRNVSVSSPKLSLEQLFLKTVEYERAAQKPGVAKPTNER